MLCEDTAECRVMIQMLCYSELITIPSYRERFLYLARNGVVGEATFGGKRWLVEKLYMSNEWRRFRDKIIIRDGGFDMAVPGYTVGKRIVVHHIDPLTVDDLLYGSSKIFDEDNVVCVAPLTHRAIHYGDESLIMPDVVDRRPNDTCPWKVIP